MALWLQNRYGTSIGPRRWVSPFICVELKYREQLVSSLGILGGAELPFEGRKMLLFCKACVPRAITSQMKWEMDLLGGGGQSSPMEFPQAAVCGTETHFPTGITGKGGEGWFPGLDLMCLRRASHISDLAVAVSAWALCCFRFLMFLWLILLLIFFRENICKKFFKKTCQIHWHWFIKGNIYI